MRTELHEGISVSRTCLTLLSCFSPAAALHSCRSAEARTAAAGLQEDMGSMLGWLDKAEGVLAIPLQPADPQHIRDTLGKVQVPLRHNTAVNMSHWALCVCVWVCAEQCNLISLLSYCKLVLYNYTWKKNNFMCLHVCVCVGLFNLIEGALWFPLRCYNVSFWNSTLKILC